MSERAPWGNFPTVIRNGDLGSLSAEPEYAAAKAGDWQAALDIVDRLLSSDTVAGVHEALAGAQPLVLPVLAQEASGRNKIPLAFANVLAHRLGLQVETGIGQRAVVGRTGSGSDHRLVANPTFAGEVQRGQAYLIVDDTLSMGGTLASLRGYLENRGGHVVLAAVMTAHHGAVDLPVKQKMLDAIERKHGPAMNEMWKENFSYGIDQLTQGEAGHLKAAASVEAMRVRLDDARNAIGQRKDAGRASSSQQEGRQLTAKSLPAHPEPTPHVTPRQRMRELVELLPGARLQISSKGVPMAVFGNATVCWFGKGGFYRVFDSFASNEDTRRDDYATAQEVVRHFATRGISPTSPSKALEALISNVMSADHSTTGQTPQPPRRGPGL